jgi:hypothetical protein
MHIGEAGAKLLLEVLCINSTLQSLSLNGYFYYNHCLFKVLLLFILLLEALFNCTDESVDSRGTVVLAKALKTNSSLTSQSLS